MISHCEGCLLFVSFRSLDLKRIFEDYSMNGSSASIFGRKNIVTLNLYKDVLGAFGLSSLSIIYLLKRSHGYMKHFDVTQLWKLVLTLTSFFRTFDESTSSYQPI